MTAPVNHPQKKWLWGHIEQIELKSEDRLLWQRSDMEKKGALIRALKCWFYNSLFDSDLSHVFCILFCIMYTFRSKAKKKKKRRIRIENHVIRCGCERGGKRGEKKKCQVASCSHYIDYNYYCAKLEKKSVKSCTAGVEIEEICLLFHITFKVV